MFNSLVLASLMTVLSGQDVITVHIDDRGESPRAEAVYYLISDDVWLSIDRVDDRNMTARACFTVYGSQACSVVDMMDTLDVQPETTIEWRDDAVEVHVYFYRDGIEAKQLHYIHGIVVDGLDAYICEDLRIRCQD